MNTNYQLKEASKTDNIIVSVTISIIGILFIVAKLFGYSNLSWGWTLAPFWLPMLALLVVVFLVFFSMGMATLFRKVF